MTEVEQHPFSPFLPQKAKLLILGSFPPPAKRWSMNFYYPNLQNDFWRICGLIFFNNKDYFLMKERKAFNLEAITLFLEEKGIALYDTASAVRRLKDNASDKFLEVVTPTDVTTLLEKIPLCRTITTTGEKATELLLPQFGISKAPQVGSFIEFIHKEEPFRLYRMPSSSRAYPLPISRKADQYRILFDDIGL
jgi:hypoxanthine-DNA glycosylase